MAIEYKPILKDVPNILGKNWPEKMDVSTKANLSNKEYNELSIEDKRVENIEFIVSIIMAEYSV